MITKLLNPNKKSITLACKLIKQGKVVGVPTETVYGLAGDSSNPLAIKRIFEAKGRPSDNPLIVHISNMEMLEKVVSIIPEDAKKLAKVFWPGPLTMILPKGKGVCSESCAGLDSVGVRMPSNQVVREIIEQLGVPFSAPSANLSGKPSPTNAQDVYADMNGRIPLIIDDGSSNAGVESTVVSLLSDVPVILRPGIVTKEDIQRVLQKPVLIAKEVTEELKNSEPVRSPGMKYKHYSPTAEVTVIKGSFKNFKNFVEKNNGNDVFAMCFDNEEKLLAIKSLPFGQKNDALSQAHNLFTVLRQLDKLGAKIVYARCPESTGVSLAVYNRLIRSAGFKIIEV